MIYSYLPVDVGFDLRLHGHAIVLPEDATEIRFMRGHDETVVTGNRTDLAAALRDAGYSVSTTR